jgi:3'-phosphoadenosine 5'-phosphosulfate sulfotransferase (PAPS reductase)/FAD synthetase/16S rRNA G966 N2-methylase RsmD
MQYPGKKANTGIVQFLINNTPFHTRYFELFAGTGHLYFSKLPAAESLLCDMNADQVAYLISNNRSNNTLILQTNALHLIDTTDFTRSDFLYLDPPYPFLSRRAGRKYYRHEMTDDDHVQLLTAVRTMDANIMISTRQNELYELHLSDWRKKSFSTMDRAGKVEEIIYMNYQDPELLHQYDYLGNGYIDRQRVKRKIQRFTNKLAELPTYEKHLFIQQMIENDWCCSTALYICTVRTVFSIYNTGHTDKKAMNKELKICSVSGGKDSTALYCLMVEFYGHDFLPLFADTGNEHPVTVNYVRNLHIMAGGPEVQICRADFTEKLATKRMGKVAEAERMIYTTLSDGRFDFNPQEAEIYNKLVADANKLRTTNNPFLDMMIWKGRAPSTKAQFCTEWVKLWPQLLYLEQHFPLEQWVMFSGIRQAESLRRQLGYPMPFTTNSYFDCDYILPLLYSDLVTILGYLESKGVPLNPLYALGYGRVGCFPCIHANKEELSLLPEWSWDKLEYWESKLGRSWFPSGILPGKPKGYIPSINEVREWCKTIRGGKQYDLFKSITPADAPSCMSTWGICE